ncbi:sucrase ferredoxin [Saccharospirillum salsuginis]|uniref:Sucrase ferredoxin n=1 Tax=Saccharospirillum salsuginis TaxID=418750 RepID=A0A918KB61_9GAMM|nr:sucrase ferredoxin [Saccharospirillum salsuginis]GGX54959.1 hypothetical protein GCM10007392_23120 [Saccharospirillum salsuginis]
MTQFCAQYSRKVDEPLAGTGAHPRTNLLLSWPIGSWTRTFHQAKNMSEDVSNRVKDLIDSGRRINLIHRADQPGDRHRAYLMPEKQAFDIPHADIEAFLTALYRGDSLDAWSIGEVRHKVVLCCTHGVKDKCCAKFGNASFKALDAAATGYDGAFEIWQSTHLGGCRLASAALVFPDMHKYGRIDAEHVEGLLASEYDNHPYLPCYRGDGALPPAQQIADIEARRQLHALGVRPRRVNILSEERENEEVSRVDLQWHSETDQGRLTIDLEALTSVRYATCADIDDGEEPVAHPTWQPVSTDAVQHCDPTDADSLIS